MNSELFVKIMLSIITLISALISAYVIPYLKTKVTEKQLMQLDYFVEVAVRCANQIYSPEDYKMKKAFVFDYVTNVIDEKLSIKLSAGDIDTIIEGIVNEVKKGDD